MVISLATASALHIDEVETGVDYAVLVSTCSGAWRYLIGDTVRFLNLGDQRAYHYGSNKAFFKYLRGAPISR